MWCACHSLELFFFFSCCCGLSLNVFHWTNILMQCFCFRRNVYCNFLFLLLGAELAAFQAIPSSFADDSDVSWASNYDTFSGLQNKKQKRKKNGNYGKTKLLLYLISPMYTFVFLSQVVSLFLAKISLALMQLLWKICWCIHSHQNICFDLFLEHFLLLFCYYFDIKTPSIYCYIRIHNVCMSVVFDGVSKRKTIFLAEHPFNVIYPSVYSKPMSDGVIFHFACFSLCLAKFEKCTRWMQVTESY